MPKVIVQYVGPAGRRVETIIPDDDSAVQSQLKKAAPKKTKKKK